MKIYLPLLCLLVFGNVYSQWKPHKEDLKIYKKVIAQLNEMEPYTHFFENENREVKNKNSRYYELRWAYLKDVAYQNPKVTSPTTALTTFLDACKKESFIESKTASFMKSANIVGYELITDAPAFEVEDSDISSYKNIAYVTHNGYNQRLDLYLPKKVEKKPIPCIIFIHGGGWQIHKRAWFEGQAKYVASKGYAAVTIDYRMLNAVTPLECNQDAKAAVRWVRANARKFGIDPNKIGACGASAGGQITATLATTSNIKILEGLGDNLDVSSEIQAGVGLATPVLSGNKNSFPLKGKASKPNWYDLISPYKHISPDDAPMLFLHGEKDATVMPSDPKDMYDKYRELGITAELEYIKNQGHVFYMNKETTQKALDFFKKIFD